MCLIQLWLSKNNQYDRSQYFHFDQIHPRQFKVILNVNDVTNENGPFTFIPKTKSYLKKKNNCMRNFDKDSTFQQRKTNYKTCRKKRIFTFIDSSSCLHQIRIKKGHRLMLMIQYAPYHCVKETSDLAWQKISNKIFLQKSKKYFEKYLFKLPPSPFIKN